MKKSWEITALLLGVVFDFLFWKKNPSISFPIFIWMSLITGYLISTTSNVPISRKNIILLIPIFFFSTMTFIRQDLFTTLLIYALVVITSVILVMTFQNGLWPAFSAVDYFSQLFQLIGSIFKFPLFTRSKITPDAFSENKTNFKNTIWPFVRGVLLAIPFLFIFIALFSSADPGFNQRVDSLFSNLRIEKLSEYVFRGINILFIANIFAGIFVHAAEKSQTDKLFGDDTPFIKPFFGSIETCIILGSVLTLFLSFIRIQLRYFFFGNANIASTGFSYAEYARHGFGELIAVAVISLILLLSFNTITKKTGKKQDQIFSLLSAGLVGAVFIILASAFQRLFLYESAYDFSKLRTYSHVFMIWLGILLAAIVIIEVINRPRAFGNITLITVMGSACSLNILNVDSFIIRQNIARVSQGMELDVPYLSSLTKDAVPSLVHAYTSSNIPDNTRQEIGAILSCFWVQIEADKEKKQAWQSFHLSDWKAARELIKIANQLEYYQVQEKDEVTEVTTPEGIQYPCIHYRVLK